MPRLLPHHHCLHVIFFLFFYFFLKLGRTCKGLRPITVEKGCPSLCKGERCEICKGWQLEPRRHFYFYVFRTFFVFVFGALNTVHVFFIIPFSFLLHLVYLLLWKANSFGLSSWLRLRKMFEVLCLIISPLNSRLFHFLSTVFTGPFMLNDGKYDLLGWDEWFV